MRQIPLLLLLFILAAGAEQAYSQSCPVVTVTCPDRDDSLTLTFVANVSGADPSVKLTFDWTVSPSKITSGQGTTTINVDSTDFGGQASTATVEVGGLPKGCENKASCSTSVCRLIRPRLVAEYGDLSWAEEKALLDTFAGYLKETPAVLHHRRSQYRRSKHRSGRRERSKSTMTRKLHG
jgi:hypothetical protein